MDEIVCFTILGEKKEYKKGTKFADIAKEYQKEYKDDIVLVSLDNRLSELFKPAEKGGNLSFVTTGDTAGRKAYRRSVTLMMQKAVHHILGNDNSRVRVCHCISQAYYCELVNYGKPGEKFVEALKEEMRRMVEKEIPIMKDTLTTDDAVKLFHDLGMTDKERLFRYRRSSRVNIYSLDNYIDYFYGFMVPNTSYLKYFDVQIYGNGFVLMFPNENTKEVADFTPSAKHFETLKESSKWGQTMGIGTVGALNDAIASGRMQEIIMVQEALMEQRIGQLANQIKNAGSKKFVMIAGPSSSGKTTFSHRLSIQLSALGLKPHPLSLDNYYIDRTLCPRDAEGNFDFECLEALDVQKFNLDMCDLLAGKTVDMPTFNFKTGKREYKDRLMTLGDNDILVIEGIHGLNDKLSHTLPSESKFKIFISALTQINIDEHNYLPTTDGRLIRRIVRDARTRNTTAEETIAMWRSVRRGEEKYIFPFQESADVMFNSGLIYELAVLKAYAEPLLFHIDKDSKEYIEAKRLLKFLDYLLPVPSEDIAKNSIIREFIGGSMFNV
ncbi:MAG: nucleoside kinase [Lachnospiraceae bacterium]|jgi:Uridine kinase|uniref:nucleoside kinase n=1 Tax=Roseburia sp. 1XD42-69 TaxID=2320088 RepID=UPI000EA18316|nr:nucleoside kinase [Roseburia sp. 1XD42-69]MCI8876420.1 nucleoside kinase [Lachnospiraceae bacterium]RKJ63094.1 nucleoside kinase [Roseburia sp. 1XD42-69]